MTHTEIRDAIITNGWQSKPAGEIAELLNAPQTVRGTFMASLGTPMKYLGAEAGAQYWAITDTVNSRLLAAGSLSAAQLVTSGNTFTLAAFDIAIPNQ